MNIKCFWTVFCCSRLCCGAEYTRERQNLPLLLSSLYEGKGKLSAQAPSGLQRSCDPDWPGAAAGGRPCGREAKGRWSGLGTQSMGRLCGDRGLRKSLCHQGDEVKPCLEQVESGRRQVAPEAPDPREDCEPCQ